MILSRAYVLIFALFFTCATSLSAAFGDDNQLIVVEVDIPAEADLGWPENRSTEVANNVSVAIQKYLETTPKLSC